MLIDHFSTSILKAIILSGSTSRLNPDQRCLLIYAKRVARTIPSRAVGGLTAIIGELSACERMHVNWQPSEGFDAIKGRGERISIKTRVIRKDRDPSPTMGRFRRNKLGQHPFDFGWYVELYENYELRGIWATTRRTVATLQAARSSHGISIAKFKKKSDPIWLSTALVSPASNHPREAG
jgi:hypothetical protein